MLFVFNLCLFVMVRSKLEADKVDKGKKSASKGKGKAPAAAASRNKQIKKKLTICMMCKMKFDDMEQVSLLPVV